MYIRYASGLVMDSAKLFHLIVVVFLIVWFTLRNLYLPFIQLWRGLAFKQHPFGKICMRTNLSLTYDGEIDNDFDLLVKKVGITIVLSFLLSMYILIYGSYSSFRDR